MEKSNLNERIVSLTKDFWKAEKRPLLLSSLGASDSGEIARSARVFHATLAEYIKSELGANLRVVSHSSRTPIIGVVPINKETAAIKNDDALLEKSVEPRSDVGKTVRFHPIFWQAFKTPLGKEQRRFISTDARLQVFDLPENDSPPPNTQEITKKFILSSGDSADDQAVLERITEWLQEHNFPTDYFSAKNAAIRFKQIAQRPQNNLLGVLLDSLNENELRRITMSLDIVEKLSKTKS